MNLGCLLRLLGSLIAAGIVLIVGFGSFWLLWEVSRGFHGTDTLGEWMLNILGIILGLIGLVVCMILIGVVVRFVFVWGRRRGGYYDALFCLFFQCAFTYLRI